MERFHQQRLQVCKKDVEKKPPSDFPFFRFSTFIDDLTNYLFNLSAQLNLSKPRYYADSQQHRSKLRIMQALAVLFGRSNKAWDIRLQTALLSENNQPNVTFILELIIGATIDPKHLTNLLAEVSRGCRIKAIEKCNLCNSFHRPNRIVPGSQYS